MSNDLVVERWEGENDGLTQRDIEILKGDSEHMRSVKLPQCLGSRLARPVVLDAIQIRVYLHSGFPS